MEARMEDFEERASPSKKEAKDKKKGIHGCDMPTGQPFRPKKESPTYEKTPYDFS